LKKFIVAALILAVLFSVFFYQLTKRLAPVETFGPGANGSRVL